VGASGPAGDPFDALGDPNRRAIVEILGSGSRSVREIADALPISRPAVSRHLRLLKDAGLVVEQAEGTRRIYRLHDEGVATVQRYLLRVWGTATARFRLAAQNLSPDHAGAENPSAKASPGRAGQGQRTSGPDSGRGPAEERAS
jgi:DNA-binding transcriptional ArsR family regulator